MSISRVVLGWIGLLAGLGVAAYSLFIYWPSYVVAVPHTANNADHALARTVVIAQLMRREYQATVGIVLGMMLALVTVFLCGLPKTRRKPRPMEEPKAGAGQLYF